MRYRYHLVGGRDTESVVVTGDIEVARDMAKLMTDREVCKKAGLRRYWAYLELHDELEGRTIEAWEFGEKAR